ncbi:hypothetical protein IV38_GL001697 [Lactobacillus selangorensis]|uniref:Uncharacterized protein n=1 Tax=Lactobacillus selangorensis TaxID=81857 RepID=A0A0R2FI11_9LACO|nr:hypothetical protein [Lactobacillus selangorensis]KRN28243.1 hypothetical protein IV38_GL001697 [Lactobacillus selangorensis]KRN30881.1 hypothetical protein IV40_GL001518 [Lactobacillus selangorensis]
MYLSQKSRFVLLLAGNHRTDDPFFTASFWRERYRIHVQWYLVHLQRQQLLEVRTVQDASFYEWTQAGARVARDAAYLTGAYRRYVPGVVDLKTLRRVREQHAQLCDWQLVQWLLKNAEERALAQHQYEQLLLLKKHRLRLYQSLHLPKKSLRVLLQIMVTEMEALTFQKEQPSLAHYLSTYELQKVQELLEQLDLTLDDFMVLFGQFLDQQKLSIETPMTHFEMMSFVGFELVQNYDGLQELYQRIRERLLRPRNDTLDRAAE